MSSIENSNKKAVNTFYLIIMPILTLSFLLGVSSIVSRPNLLESELWDFAVRTLLSIWFSGLYIRLSRIANFSFYPNKKWAKSDVKSSEIIVYKAMGVLFGLISAVITFWMIKTFLPFSKVIEVFVALLNGIIIMYPIITHYWVLKF